MIFNTFPYFGSFIFASYVHREGTLLSRAIAFKYVIAEGGYALQ